MKNFTICRLFCIIAVCLISLKLPACADQAGNREKNTLKSGQPNSQDKKVPKICPIRLTEIGWNHLGTGSYKNLVKLRDAGANSVVAWVGYPRPPFESRKWWTDPAAIEKLQETGRRCSQIGIDFYVITYMGLHKQAYPDEGVGTSLNMDGQGGKVPSWLDPVFWNKIVIPRDRALAELAQRGLLKGILWDIEVYQQGALMERGQLDFGDTAMKRFYKDMDISHKIPDTEERAEHLLSSGLIGPYIEWHQRQLKNFASKWAQEMRKISPKITLGFYNPGMWHSGWTVRSIAQGMNDTEHEILILDASTYPGIGNSWTLGLQVESIEKWSRIVEGVALGQWGLNAQISFGMYTYPVAESYTESPLWKRCLDPDSITTFLRAAARAGNGWWIWNEHGDPDKVLESIRRAD